MEGRAAGTIVAKNRLAHARVLARSFSDHHPSVPFFICLADEIEGRFDPSSEPFSLVSWKELDVSDPVQLRFRYDQQAFSYALTATFLRHLLDRGFSRVLFLKQESLVVGSLGPVFLQLDASPLVLTPHLLEPLPGPDGGARELEILRAGVFNLGLLGVSEGATARRFLAWWEDRLRLHCRRAVGEGMHFEQRWMDLVPALFEGAHVLRDPGANVGHWNLPERRVEGGEGGLTLGPGPVRLFRFSGFDPAEPAWPTCHTRRISMADIGPAAEVFSRYANLLAESGDAAARLWLWAYARFDNGVPVPGIVRDVYREAGEAAKGFGDPLSTGGARTFYAWLNSPSDESGSRLRGLTRLWLEVYRRRPDVQRAFPDVFGADARRFVEWTERHGAVEYGVPDAFLPEKS